MLESYDRAKAPGATLPLTRDALLDQTAAEICIHDTTRGTRNRGAKLVIADLLLARKPFELLRLEDPQTTSSGNCKNICHPVI